MGSPQRATMDFFQCQQSARHKTALLIFLFLLAVACIILGVYLAVGRDMGSDQSKQLIYKVKMIN
jgi:ABC-type transporter Mla subunit MlaD